ncbi:MAG: YdcH family protein [Gammaproteobacteria bacterium]|jgi:uncharacterized protein YdcH (DUF465 family)
MYGVRHVIEGEFPEFQRAINRLKNKDPDFTRLLVEYDETDKRIYGLEQQSVPISDAHFGDLKRHRLVLKDQLYSILKQQTFS